MSMLTTLLADPLGRTVINRTGLTGNYDVKLYWTPEESGPPMFKGSDRSPTPPGAPAADSAPSLFTAIQEQLGLKLESQKGPWKFS